MAKKTVSAYKRFNDRLGDKLAEGLSTMECFYIIMLLVLLPLFFSRPTSPIEWVQYAVQTFFQGVALPVLGYVGWKSGERAEKTINATHAIAMKELKMIKEELALAKEERAATMKILAGLQKNLI